MVKSFLFLLFSLGFGALFAQSVHYELSMPKPQNHYFNVEMKLNDFSEDEINVKMPVWSPGSYLVREFARNVNLVKAKDENGNALSVHKTSKNTWNILKGNAKTVTVNYEVYAFELSVRTSFLDMTHGFVSGSSVFMYVDGKKELAGDLTIVPYQGFKTITTALPLKSEGVVKDGEVDYSFTNYDHLVDCPIEIGNQQVFEFDAAGVHHTVGVYGDGNYNIAQLQKDMARIVESATNIFKVNPNKEYTFIIHNVVDGQGGLEHTNSTTLSVNRWTYEGSSYIGFLSLVAHEYFHLWNVKRIRPIELGPFDYDQENYTSLLWVMEGFTSYYDELILRRAGYYTQEEYLARLKNTINYVEGSTGTRVQPVAHASFDAWIKSYRPNENSHNTTMSYYSRGQMLASLLDAMIVKEYNGKKSLDDFMQVLYKKFYMDLGRGFSEEEFQAELSAFMKTDMSDFFNKYVNGTETPDFNSAFGPVGVNVSYAGVNSPSVGLSLKDVDGKVIVRSIRSNSAAENAGLSVNDEIIGCNGYRVNYKQFNASLDELSNGDRLALLISRDELLYEIIVTVDMYERPKYEFVNNDAKNAQNLRNYWLRSDDDK